MLSYVQAETANISWVCPALAHLKDQLGPDRSALLHPDVQQISSALLANLKRRFTRWDDNASLHVAATWLDPEVRARGSHTRTRGLQRMPAGGITHLVLPSCAISPVADGAPL